MKTINLLSAAIIIACCLSCNQHPVKTIPPEKADIPDPLKENSDVNFIRKSSMRGESLTDEIYYDLVKKQPQLQKLENMLTHFNNGQADSLQAFENYDGKSESYYASATETLTNITDTVLRQRLKLLIANSKGKYLKKVSKITALEKSIKDEQLAINNFHETLKIVATLPIIEKYQDKANPDAKSVQNLADEALNLKAKTIKLAKEYEAGQK